MPSIEIICVEQAEPLRFVGLPFEFYAETDLISHRGPTPLFQPDFDAMSGCIYHVVQQSGGLNAGDLLEGWDNLKFEEYYAPYIKKLLEVLLQSSPIHRLVFTSDYQFGPDVRRYKRPRTIDKFWETHDEGKLRFNALYPLCRE